MSEAIVSVSAQKVVLFCDKILTAMVHRARHFRIAPGGGNHEAEERRERHHPCGQEPLSKEGNRNESAQNNPNTNTGR